MRCFQMFSRNFGYKKKIKHVVALILIVVTDIMSYLKGKKIYFFNSSGYSMLIFDSVRLYGAFVRVMRDIA